jgi:hypothetical protein
MRLAVALLLLATALPARGEERIHIDIRGSAGRDYQIAVQEFAAEGDAERLARLSTRSWSKA